MRMAIADYICYPDEIIAPRVESLNIRFEHDNVTATNNTIEETTERTVFAFLEANSRLAEEIIPPYIVRPDLSETKLLKWIKDIKEYNESELDIQIVDTDSDGNQWLELSYQGDIFYAKYREKPLSKCLIVSLPCMNADWNDISYLYNAPCDILQIVPLGYNTPRGFAIEKRKFCTWPVLLDTVTEIYNNIGYTKWFQEVCMAINAFKKDKKLIFIGTSQGGGASLVLSSIFNEITEACLAEMPFFIGLSDKNYSKVRDYVASKTGKMVYDFYAREHLYVIDPIAHINRIKCKTLLVAGELDDQCPKEDIVELNDKLNCEKKYVELKSAEHGYTEDFKLLAKYFISEILGRRI